MVVSVEDSPVIVKLLQAAMNESCPGVPFVCHPNLMQAACDMRNAAGVILDWTLDDGIDAVESGVIDYLKARGIPYVVFTVSPKLVSPHVGCRVIDKSEVQTLVNVVKGWVGL